MSPQTFLERTADLDMAIRHVDTRLLLAYAKDDVHPKILGRLLSVRNDLSREWGAMWRTTTITGAPARCDEHCDSSNVPPTGEVRGPQ